mmetsp:Transcript_38695/g.152769  ORF Transcript_38695/g.152769 Transcript_38695/m.152769 type:complete len:422 (-) Transcript_38695:4150-5415(-)
MDNGQLPTTRNASPAVSRKRSRRLSQGARFALVAAKASRVLAVFLTFDYLTSPIVTGTASRVLTTLPLQIFLFLAMSGASIVLLLLQKPWQGKPLGLAELQDVVVGGALLALTMYVYAAGLRACGPMRALLLDCSELPMLYTLNLIRGRDRPSRRKIRGLVLVLLSYALIMYDASGRESGDAARLASTKLGMKAEKALESIKAGAEAKIENVAEQLSKRHQGQKDAAPRMRRLLGEDLDVLEEDLQNFGLGELKGANHGLVVADGALRIELGIFLVLCSSALTLGSSGYRRKLAMVVGGTKRSFALSVSMAAVLLLPCALLSVYQESSILTLGDLGYKTAGSIFGIGNLFIVVPYYIRAFLATFLSHSVLLRAAPINFLLGVLLASTTGYGTEAGSATVPLGLAFVFNVMGLHAVSSGDSD